MIKRQALLLAALAGLSMTSAMAETAGTWTIGAGAAYVDPKSNNGVLSNGARVDVDSDIKPTLTAEYFVMNNVGVELLASLPFRHDIELKNADGTRLTNAKTQLLPPTLSLQYHFDGINPYVTPFIGVGANYTSFFKERSGIPGTKLDIKNKWAAAGHVGFDFNVTPTEAIRLDARYIDLKPDVRLNGQKVGKADLKPWVYGVSYVKRF
ncbi:OmpW/AlkL family protein [Psychrobacter lutiphocae]|uniref:OmpW/AlkL family protein n=1 Tax=Psychrobacter lutiphocae TaxID=540500 RepID=UPI0003613BC1|nr:OmpW family outer membrane protein [Psychrobacter lutiphocae]